MNKLFNMFTRSTSRHLAVLCLGLASSTQAVAAPPFLLVVYASGGWDPSMVFDGKPGTSTVDSESGQSQATGGGGITYTDHADRPAVQTFFTTYGDRSAIINGLFVGGMDRFTAQKQLFTIVPTSKARPVDWATLYADSSGFAGDLPHVVFQAPFAPGEYLDKATHLSTATIAEYQAAVPNSLDFGSSGEDALKALRGAAMVKIMNNVVEGSLDIDKLKALATSNANEAKLTAQLKTATTAVGDQGTSDTFAYQAKLALALFAQGASIAATVQAGATGAWATTKNHTSVQSSAYQSLFADLTEIISYAQSRGISDRLTLVVMSDGGRAPRLNADAGKGPWPCTSMLLWGAGVNGGKVIGLTDGFLRGLPIDPIFGGTGKPSSILLTPASVWGALYTKAGYSTTALLGDTAPLAQVIK